MSLVRCCGTELNPVVIAVPRAIAVTGPDCNERVAPRNRGILCNGQTRQITIDTHPAELDGISMRVLNHRAHFLSVRVTR